MTVRGFGAALLLAGACTFSAVQPAAADTSSPGGKWRIYHPQSGQPHMIIEIEEKGGALEGHIVELADGPKDAVCWSCSGENHNKPLAGMKIIWDARQDGQGWSGALLRPATGMVSPAYFELVPGGAALQMTTGRGPLRVTQKWERIE
ncbi:conserved hypothetical protein [Parvibaculum lavamentivorans DS-1]|uniref:DUF2147 domain-containing protein n=1 Tax=Parvibaculum lavamentivorans (strain DS-1 / DSM 13023 / NCIMB 13966) TaxID=402881 RepID=A7HWH3_PARL1|nr:DUF2147 domain-containing protein [Parvibaculum lavamentivorans]ABS64256.1 conserved hypothetical protein [Parvibaculum lavamentivorans DS-1]